MHVLVTGGAGFIGSHVVRLLLEQGETVRVLDSIDPQVHSQPPSLHSDAEFIEGDVRDHVTVAQALDGIDRLVHLAAAVGVGQSMYEIERYTSVNAVGAAVVLEEATAARGELEKVVVASSMSIYGEGLYRCPVEDTFHSPRPRSLEQLKRREWELSCEACGAQLQAVPTPESKPLQPLSIYAIGKRDHEEMFLAWARAYGVSATALRFFNVYGPGQALSNPYTGVAAIFASRILNGRPAVVFEDGGQSRDFVHVKDIAAGVVASLEPGRADLKAMNLGAGRGVSVLDVAAAVAAGYGVELEVERPSTYRAGDIRHCFADVSLARAELGFEPRVQFEDGMQQYAEWLHGRTARDGVDAATAALVSRGLTI